MVSTMTADALLEKKAETKDKDKGTLVLLDAREPFEYQVSHLEGAVNLPIATSSDEELQELIDKKVAPEGDIVCYCLLGGRGMKLAEKVEAIVGQMGGAPRPAVHLLEGSLSAWALAGKPMVDGNGQTTKKVNVDKAPDHVKEQLAEFAA